MQVDTGMPAATDERVYREVSRVELLEALEVAGNLDAVGQDVVDAVAAVRRTVFDVGVLVPESLSMWIKAIHDFAGDLCHAIEVAEGYR